MSRTKKQFTRPECAGYDETPHGIECGCGEWFGTHEGWKAHATQGVTPDLVRVFEDINHGLKQGRKLEN